MTFMFLCVCVVCAVHVYTSERTCSSASLLLLYSQSDNSSSDNMTYAQTTISHNNKTTCLVLCRLPNRHKTSGVVVWCLALGCWQWIFRVLWVEGWGLHGSHLFRHVHARSDWDPGVFFGPAFRWLAHVKWCAKTNSFPAEHCIVTGWCYSLHLSMDLMFVADRCVLGRSGAPVNFIQFSIFLCSVYSYLEGDTVQKIISLCFEFFSFDLYL